MLSLRQKLLFLILPLCLVPLIAISVFSYFQARDRITEDRLVLFLEQIARDISDTIHLTLLEKTEEVVSMSLYGELREYVRDPRKPPPQDLLDVLIEIHEVYDFLVLFDKDGRIVLTNSHDRNRIAVHLNEAKLKKLRGRSVLDFTPDAVMAEAGDERPVCLPRLASVGTGRTVLPVRAGRHRQAVRARIRRPDSGCRRSSGGRNTGDHELGVRAGDTRQGGRRP